MPLSFPDLSRRVIVGLSLAVAALAAIAFLEPFDRGGFRQPTADPMRPPACAERGAKTFDFRVSANQKNPAVLEAFKNRVGEENAIVRLGPDVELDFTGLPGSFFPIYIARCVTLMSVNAFPDSTTHGDIGRGEVVGAERERGGPAVRSGGDSIQPGDVAGAEPPARPASGRSPRSLGPILRFGTEHRGDPMTFLEVRCFAEGALNDGVRIQGIRVFGPTFDYQRTDEVGIRILGCMDVEVSNMELAGWGGSAVEVAGAGLGRLVKADQVRIFGNYIHHNQHPSRPVPQPPTGSPAADPEPSSGGSKAHAAGYGVNVGAGGWAQITENVFDANRHAIAADGDSGGYVAARNLVLKGGGIHDTLPLIHTHQFDVHGDDECFPYGDASCGNAGHRFAFLNNAFQYRNDNAIKLRGRPRERADISGNIFPHPGFEDDDGADALYLQTGEHIYIGPGNQINIDTFGQYAVCDFDGDAVDDLFLATGASWWYSSFGEFHWSYMNDNPELRGALKFGYFDNDTRCDVVAERDGRWFMSSGGYGDWQPFGEVYAPLAQVEFGRFDPLQSDTRPGGVTRLTTHVFWHRSGSDWAVHAIDDASPEWTSVPASGDPLEALKFGDFTGDGNTDILTVHRGRWWISDAARTWRQHHRTVGTPMEGLKIANLDADDNIDDVLLVEHQPRQWGVRVTWHRSKNGTEPWEQLKSYEFAFIHSSESVPPGYAFAGRFGAAPGGGVLVNDHKRNGLFYSPAEAARGLATDFRSLFPY